MRIAVNMSFEKPEVSIAFERFAVAFIEKMIAEQEKHEFLIITSRDAIIKVSPAANTSFYRIPGLSKNSFLKKWWYDVKLPRLLRKEKAEVLVCATGYCSLALKIPQVLLLHEPAYLYIPKLGKGNYFVKPGFPDHFQKALKVLVISKMTRRNVIEQFLKSPDDIVLISALALPGYRPTSWQDKELVKTAYSGSREFFLYRGMLAEKANILNLLKAFSLFKKRQQTNMQMLIVAEESDGFEQLKEKLATYKYMSDVKLLLIDSPIELQKITAAAYAVIIPGRLVEFEGPVWETLQCEVPLLASEASGLAESIGDAAMYFDPASPDSIATQMKTIFKDENLRNELIENGRQLEKQDWDQACNLAWLTISNSLKTELST